MNIQKEIGGAVNYGQVAADLLVSTLSTQVDVINRDQIKRLLEEQGRRYDEHFDASQAPEFGKLLGVDAIVTGAITALNVEEASSSGLGSVAGAILPGRIPKMGNASKNVKVEVVLAAQVISTASGKTLGAPQATGKSTKSTANQVTVNNTSSGGNTTSKTGPDAQIRTAIGDAVQQIGSQFPMLLASAKLSNQPLPKPTDSAPAPDYVPLPEEVGNVVKLEGDSLIFLVAPDAHITAGETLEVDHPDLTRNPRTGKQVAIGSLMGTLKVSEVTKDQARGKYTGKPVSDQDRVIQKSGAAKSN